MKPLAGFIGYNSEWRELAQVISRVFKNKYFFIIANDLCITSLALFYLFLLFFVITISIYLT